MVYQNMADLYSTKQLICATNAHVHPHMDKDLTDRKVEANCFIIWLVSIFFRITPAYVMVATTSIVIKH
jgi:hypothetical protein